MKNVKKKKVAAPSRTVKKSVAANRITVFFVVLIVVVVAIMWLKDGSASVQLNFYNYVRPVLVPVFALLTAGSLALWLARRKNGTDESTTSFPASLLTIIAVGLFAVCVAYPLLSTTRLLVSLIAVSALYFIYYLYPRSFFAYSAVTLVGGLMLSFFRFGSGLLGWIVPITLLVAVEVAIVMMLVGGKNPLGSLLSAEKEDRYPVIITAAILLAGLVVGLLAPSLLFYAIVLLFASFLVIAIMNTLRMM